MQAPSGAAKEGGRWRLTSGPAQPSCTLNLTFSIKPSRRASWGASPLSRQMGIQFQCCSLAYSTMLHPVALQPCPQCPALGAAKGQCAMDSARLQVPVV
jgi:hypothetical protein